MQHGDIAEVLDVEDQDAEEGAAAEDVDAGDTITESNWALNWFGAGELFLVLNCGKQIGAG